MKTSISLLHQQHRDIFAQIYTEPYSTILVCSTCSVLAGQACKGTVILWESWGVFLLISWKMLNILTVRKDEEANIKLSVPRYGAARRGQEHKARVGKLYINVSIQYMDSKKSRVSFFSIRNYLWRAFNIMKIYWDKSQYGVSQHSFCCLPRET